MFYVIGSGPAGVSAARALVDQGVSVTVLDVGLELEPERQRMVEALRNRERHDWDPQTVDRIRSRTSPGVGGIPVKYSYGSDYPYREVDERIGLETNGVKARRSFAKGGLSTVWGGGMLPFLDRDLAAWPLTANDLAPHYEAVLKAMDYAAVEDDLGALFPLYGDHHRELRPSRQAARLLRYLARHRDALRSRGVYFGSSRLAVRSRPLDGRSGCIYCGMCLHGCPHELIYNSAQAIEELGRREGFRYRPEVVVERVAEEGKSVRIEASVRSGGRRLVFEGDRVFVACGVLPTARIMLESMAARDHPLILRDSLYFMLPALCLTNVREVASEDLHTLCQAFIAILDPELCERTIHLSIYNSDLIETILKRSLGPAFPLLVGRLLVIAGYLHSDLSGTVEMRLTESSDHSGKLTLEARPSPEARRLIRRTVTKLTRSWRQLGLVPLAPLLKIGSPGEGNHCGGTFPMRSRPGPYESDLLGQPAGYRRTHLVDASVFPDVPATTITLSIMANAHRIARESARLT